MCYYGASVFIATLIAVYVWLVWKFCSPDVNLAFIKSAESPKRFLGVNVGVSAFFVVLISTLGACAWPLLHPALVRLGKGVLDLQMSEQVEFMWIYFCVNTLFHLLYLMLWEYLRKYRWIRRLTVPNVCW